MIVLNWLIQIFNAMTHNAILQWNLLNQPAARRLFKITDCMQDSSLSSMII